MSTVAVRIADELVRQHGDNARARALAIADAAACFGTGPECAAFFGLVADLIERASPEQRPRHV